MGFPGGSDGTESACNARDLGSIPGLGKSHGGGHGNPLQYSGLENPRGQRSLAGYGPWGCKESVTTEPLSTAQGSNPCPQDSEGRLYQTPWISCPKSTFHNLTFNATKTIFKEMQRKNNHSLKQSFHWRLASAKFVTDLSVIFELMSVVGQQFGEKNKKWKSQSVCQTGIFLFCNTHKQSQNYSTKFIFTPLLPFGSKSSIFWKLSPLGCAATIVTTALFA